MKMLLSTTALVIALGVPTVTLAQTQEPASNQAQQRQNAGAHGFLTHRSQSDLFASELMGHAVYARRTSPGTMQSGLASMTNADGTQVMPTMTHRDLDDMDHIGEINEIVLSSDGQIRAIVIGAGGFLGMGEHDIAVTMDQIAFATDQDDRSERYVVVNTRADILRDTPAYDRTAMAQTISQQQNAPTNQTTFAAPQVQRDGYDRVEATEVSADLLLGKSVYDVNDTDVGEVTDLIINDSGEITNVIIDFGGFLGIGSSQASLAFDELTILSTDGYGDVRIYVDATRDQIQNLPQYHASN
jgi:sporulation protein YlmC with PRC-barrel domain